MRTRTVDSVVEELERMLAEAPEGVVASDADGTLWTGDVGDDLFFHVIRNETLLPPALEGARTMAREHGVDVGEGVAVFEHLYEAYRAHRLPEHRIYELTAWCLAGHDHKTVEEIARRVHNPGALTARLIPEAVRVLERAPEVWVVSASPAYMVKAGLEAIGWDPDRVTAFEVSWVDGIMLPRAEPPIPYLEGKVTCLRAKIGARPVLCALGDSAFDLPMLREARIGLAVRPKPALRENATPEIAELVNGQRSDNPGALRIE